MAKTAVLQQRPEVGLTWLEPVYLIDTTSSICISFQLFAFAFVLLYILEPEFKKTKTPGDVQHT